MRVVVTRFLIPSSSKLAVSSRLMSKRLWSWKTFTESRWLTRRSSSWMRPFSMGVAAQAATLCRKRGLLAAEGAPVRARAEAEDGDHARDGPPRGLGPWPSWKRTIGHRTSRPSAARHVTATPPRRPRRPRRSVDGHARGRARGQPARGAHVVGAVLRAHEQAPARRLQLAHHDEERGVEDLVPASGRS